VQGEPAIFVRRKSQAHEQALLDEVFGKWFEMFPTVG
jgi:hypothetical protein